jgi:hypothetical protein
MFESLVRNWSNFRGGLCDLNVLDGKGDGGGNLAAGVAGRGNLLGLCSLAGSSPEPDLRVRLCMALERDTSRISWDLNLGLGQPLTKAFLGVEGTRKNARVLLGRKDSEKDAMGTDIPLGFGPSCDSSCVPNDVAGLVKPALDDARLCAKELFGRPSD